MTTQDDSSSDGPKRPEAFDVISYAGPITVQGYELLCDALADKKAKRALLVLATPGGDPHAGFRIARALQHSYDNFDALVPRYCKSAGTLILIGATKLYLDDRSELGPLDVQVKKGDELIGRNSGLDIFQAVNFLQGQALSSFRSHLHDLARDLSTRVGSEIAHKLTIGILEPIAAQIDPIKLAEMQRATEIAFEYGNRLNEKSGMLRTMGIQKLVTGYPSHGFVIDRKEARTIFARVERPEGFMKHISDALRVAMEPQIHDSVPTVNLYHFPEPDQPAEAANEDPPIAADGAGSTAPGEQPLNGRRQEPGAPSADHGTHTGASEQPTGEEPVAGVAPPS